MHGPKQPPPVSTVKLLYHAISTQPLPQGMCVQMLNVHAIDRLAHLSEN